jgi:hypothetical protein
VWTAEFDSAEFIESHIAQRDLGLIAAGGPDKKTVR